MKMLPNPCVLLSTKNEKKPLWGWGKSRLSYSREVTSCFKKSLLYFVCLALRY